MKTLFLLAMLLLSACGQIPAAVAPCVVSNAIILPNISAHCADLDKQMVAAFIQDHGTSDCLSDVYGLETFAMVTVGPNYVNTHTYSQGVLAKLKTDICASNCIQEELAVEQPNLSPTDLAKKVEWVCQ